VSLLKSKPAPKPVLDAARVEALQAEINQFINEKARDIQQGRNGETPCTGVPIQVLENILRGRIECECRAYLHIVREGTR
jgi:hypothetical protein